MSGMSVAVTVGAVVVGSAAIGVLVMLPNRAAPAPPEATPGRVEAPDEAVPQGIGNS